MLKGTSLICTWTGADSCTKVLIEVGRGDAFSVGKINAVICTFQRARRGSNTYEVGVAPGRDGL